MILFCLRRSEPASTAFGLLSLVCSVFGTYPTLLSIVVFLNTLYNNLYCIVIIPTRINVSIP